MFQIPSISLLFSLYFGQIPFVFRFIASTCVDSSPAIANTLVVESSVASHEQTQSNRVCCIPTFWVHFVSEGFLFHII